MPVTSLTRGVLLDLLLLALILGAGFAVLLRSLKPRQSPGGCYGFPRFL